MRPVHFAPFFVPIILKECQRTGSCLRIMAKLSQ
jgi:hypothetical protein